MKHKNTVTGLVVIIVLFALAATLTGIFSSGGPGPSEYLSVRGQSVTLYGEGQYRHMSADVAIQGIAQDWVTLLLGIPLLLLALVWARKQSLKGRFLLAGVLFYFLLTYLFYLNMATYNALFLVYVVLTGTSFFALALTFFSIGISNLSSHFESGSRFKVAGRFLMVTPVVIGLLWLSVVVPPLLDGTIYPVAVAHYTTLVVQGFDLSLFLPITFLAGFLLVRKQEMGYLMATVTLVFLTLLMTALVAKLVAMALAGVSIVPAIFIIPLIALSAGVLGVGLLSKIK